MEDSESNPEFFDCDMIVNDNPFEALQPPDDILERWNKIPGIVKKKAFQLMRVCAFWYHIVLHPENHKTTRWAVEVGFLDSNISNDLSLKRLKKIEILEAILRAMEKGSLSDDPTRHMICISELFHKHVPEAVANALCWLEQTGEPHIRQRVQELGPSRTYITVLQNIFIMYAHFTRAMGKNSNKMMQEISRGPGQNFIEKSEEMKTKGNYHFQKIEYDEAVRFYSKAIKYNPKNHIIYGNRSLCYIRCEKYLKAVGDGKRATLIQPEWAKGHYRYCEALFLLGQPKHALEANRLAQNLCRSDTEGMKDLLQQHLKFIELKDSIRMERTYRAKTETRQTAKASRKFEHSAKCTAPENKGLGVKVECQTQPGKVEVTSHSLDNTHGPKEKTREMADKKSSKPLPNASDKMKEKSRNQHSKEMIVSPAFPNVKDALVSTVQDAHMALADQRYRNSMHAFSHALSILETSTLKELGLCTLDKVLLIYGHATALIHIGQPEELAEARRDFEKIKTFEERTFQSLFFYGIGKVYQKENRFPIALQQFSDSMQMVKKKITPGKLTWPTTKVIVEETKPEYFKDLLEECIERCTFPPKPDAVCRHPNCHGHSKIEIYFTDPDFKGFIRMLCCQSCKVEYHISCWKKLKSTTFSDKNEKDLLQEVCFTADCGGRICHIIIYGSTGLVKCEFEASTRKPMGTVKLRINQKCTSFKNLKAKEDRKLRRKQRRQEASINTKDENDEALLKNQESIVVDDEKASSTTWLSYGDRVLLQIRENKDLFRDETHNISVLMKEMKPWMDLEQFKEDKPCTLVTGQMETLTDMVELLLERKKRVWGRIFIHFLSNCLDNSSKLYDWAQHLERAGLNAAGQFIDRYADHLATLDLAPLVKFAPLQNMLLENFGNMPDFFGHAGLTVTEYLQQAHPREKRLFVWALEEHRDQYPSCHDLLDEYFAIMDGLCLVIKKTDIENEPNSPIKTKNRNRKKKQKDPKGSVFVIGQSGMRGGTSRDEDNDYYYDDEEESLMYLEPSELFSVPSHLRYQVAAFEGQYSNASHSIANSRVLDNNPDPTKESLYDYFAQILEEHGPLGAQDPLLVGELNNFPPEAQRKIEEAGGLEPFLLESLRFVLRANLVALMKHAVLLQETIPQRTDTVEETPNDLCLNPSAFEFLPTSFSPKWSSSKDHGAVCYNDEPVATLIAQPNPGQVFPTLPSPYVFTGQPELYASGVAGVSDQSYDQNDPDVDLYSSDVDEQGPWITVGPAVPPKMVAGKRTVEIQVSSGDNMREVAVNTQPFERFERNNGDMTKKYNLNVQLEQRIRQMTQDNDSVQQRRQQELVVLEGDLVKVTHGVKIAHDELGLFQQRLEEEVKKDQKEKKENQETLKTLKTDLKELADSNESIAKIIREKKKEYDTHLNNFIELSNESAVEKMSLEDEVKRCKELCAKATRRSRRAELSILENRRECALRCPYRFLSDGKAILAKLKEVAHSFRSQPLQLATDAWEAFVQEAEEKVRTTEAQYQDQIEQVKKGARLCTLPLLATPTAPQPPPLPMLFPPPTHQVQRPPTHTKAPIYGHQGGPRAMPVPAMAQSVAPPPTMAVNSARANSPSGSVVRPPQQNQAPRPAASQPNSVYDRIVDRLSIMFPHYSRPVLSQFIAEIRTANGGCLNSMSYQTVINRVAQLILDHQDATREQLSSAGRSDRQFGGTASRSNSPASVRSTGTPPPAHVWKSLVAQEHSQSKALNMEDPCIICHEDMSQDDVCVLECRHSFHSPCIKSWLKEQSTCPTCREHVLLAEDFPVLPSRIRRRHTPANSS
ncbi:hypothetical protein UPYG_G00122920 [Umbra pygmaea]|uniref:RING-type E3 ubiquitin transferase n=1 Tax=Umbra pygmaea TaxID=75934 RepID=A0ABD0X8Q7_UMBPY